MSPDPNPSPGVLQGLWLRLRASLPVNRVVALLTAPVAALAGAFAAWLAAHFPGLPGLDPTALAAIAIAGITAVVAMAHKWLDNWAKLKSVE